MSGNLPNIEIISGDINSGKSTRLIKRVRGLKKKYRVGGVIAHPVFKEGEKSGFEIEDLSTGELFPLAENIPTSKFTHKQGRFYFDNTLFEELNNRLFEMIDNEYIIIDEIGPLELSGSGYSPALKYLLNNYKNHLILVIRNKLLSEFKNTFLIS